MLKWLGQRLQYVGRALAEAGEPSHERLGTPEEKQETTPLGEWLNLVPASWFATNEGSALWIECYRMMRTTRNDLVPGPKIIDFDRVRVLLLQGDLTYFDSEKVKIEYVTDTEWKLDGSDAKFVSTPPGAYLLLLTPSSVGGKEEPEHLTRDRVKAVVGLLASFNSRNIVFQHVFHNTLKLDSGSVEGFSPVSINPLSFPPVDTSPGRLDLLAAAGQAISKLAEVERNRLTLSLRWVERALHDSGVIAFLDYWVALETLGMPDTSDIRPLVEKLGKAYGLTYEQARDRFRIGRVFGLRARIVHDGQIVPIHDYLLRYLDALYLDLLCGQLGLQLQGRAQKLLDNPNFKLDDYLR